MTEETYFEALELKERIDACQRDLNKIENLLNAKHLEIIISYHGGNLGCKDMYILGENSQDIILSFILQSKEYISKELKELENKFGSLK